MKSLRKLSVLLIAFAMVFTMIPAVAFADDSSESGTTQYIDGYYTTTVNSNKANYGYVTDDDGNVTQKGFNYPKNDYDFPVTIQIKDGKIVDVAYTKKVTELVANTSSDINYLIWAMEGHNVTEASYNYLAKPGANYEKYHVSPAMNGKGIKEQIIEKQSTEGIDTVTAATITSLAIIDSVNQSLEKAKTGAKDDPEPVLPGPDTTKDIIPYDGVYFASDVACIGASVDNEVAPMILYVKNGKITADMAMEQRQATYPYIYVGTEAEALAAGEDAWLTPVDYDYEYKYPGSLYHNVAIPSLDKPVNIMMFAKSSGNWFNRQVTIDSSKITKVPYGDYEADGFTFEGGTGKTTITCDKVHVTKKGITFDVAFSSSKYTKLVVDGVEYAPTIKDGKSVFTVPLNINAQTVITGTTVAMSSPTDINYTVTVKFDAEDLKPVEIVYQDGYYTTTISTDRASYGWKTLSNGSIQQGLSYPNKDYEFPITVQIKDGKIVDVAYTEDPNAVMVNTSSDFNYLLWAMEGHNVTDDSYNYLAKPTGNYATYHLNPVPKKNGVGMREQIIANNGTNDVDTVTAATLTSMAIIDGVDICLEKAAKGEKDDPDPVLPTPDTSEDVIPADGYYTVEGSCVGATLDEDLPVELVVKDGKITGTIRIEQRQATYPYIYAGTETEALAAGEDGWLKPVDYDYGYKYPGSLYSNVPIKSLDKPLHFMMFAKSSGNWFNRLITLDSATLQERNPNAEEVTALIDALPENVTAEDKAKIEAASKYYDSLTDEEKAQISESELNKLQLAEARLETSEAKAETEQANKDKAAAEANEAAAKEAQAKAEKAEAEAVAAKEAAEEAQKVAEAAKTAAEEAAKTASEASTTDADAKAKAEEAAKAAQDALDKANTELAAAQKAQKAAEAKAEKALIAQKKAEAKNYTVKGFKVTVKNRKFTVKYSKNKKATGYQIQYKLKTAKKYSNLKKATTKLKFTSKKLKKGKTYQFRVRTYTTINGKKFYGKWTAVKSVKCK